MKLFINILAFLFSYIICKGNLPAMKIEETIDTLTKLTRNLDINFSTSFSTPQRIESTGLNLVINSEFGYTIKKAHQKTSRTLELNYHVGYTKLDSPVWFRDDDLLKLKAKSTIRLGIIHFNFQSIFETALTNSLIKEQKNTLPKEEFEGNKLFVPSRLLIGVGWLVNLSSTSQITLNFSPSNIRIAQQTKTLSDDTQIIHQWKNNILYYEFGMIMETDFNEKLYRNFSWKNQTTAYFGLPKTKDIKINTKNKFEYNLNPIVSLNLKSELDYNLRLSTHLITRHIIMIGVTVIK